MQDRRRRLLGDINFKKSFGVEIGALHAPVVARSEGRVVYVDYASTETLRANLRHSGVKPEDIVEVDIVWGEQPLPEAIKEPADYVVASHVMEHVPDLIGWLLEMHAALKPNGVVGLAVPDRRRTFDFYRAESSVAEVVEAYLHRARRPVMRQVFEAAAFSRNTPDDEAWQPDRRGAPLPREVLQRLPDVFQWAKNDLVTSQTYVDVHCWVFTPASFLDMAEALARIGCFPFRITGFFPTEPDSIEFQVRMRAAPSSADPKVASSIATARRSLPPAEPVPPEQRLSEARGAETPAAELLERIATLERRNKELTDALEARSA